MVKKNLLYNVQWSDIGDFSLNQDHYDIECECFGYMDQSLKKYSDFEKYYRNRAFFICNARDVDKIIAFKAVEKITPTHYHSFITAVESSYRLQGIAKEMSKNIKPFLRKSGAKYLTKFCVPEVVDFELEDDKFSLFSRELELREEEVSLILNLKNHYNSSKISISRAQSDFYDFADGNKGDALFKAYHLVYP